MSRPRNEARAPGWRGALAARVIERGLAPSRNSGSEGKDGLDHRARFGIVRGSVDLVEVVIADDALNREAALLPELDQSRKEDVGHRFAGGFVFNQAVDVLGELGRRGRTRSSSA